MPSHPPPCRSNRLTKIPRSCAGSAFRRITSSGEGGIHLRLRAFHQRRKRRAPRSRKAAWDKGFRNMGLGRFEHTDLTLIRPLTNRPNPGEMPWSSRVGRPICRSSLKPCRNMPEFIDTLTGPIDTNGPKLGGEDLGADSNEAAGQVGGSASGDGGAQQRPRVFVSKQRLIFSGPRLRIGLSPGQFSHPMLLPASWLVVKMSPAPNTGVGVTTPRGEAAPEGKA